MIPILAAADLRKIKFEKCGILRFVDAKEKLYSTAPINPNTNFDDFTLPGSRGYIKISLESDFINIFNYIYRQTYNLIVAYRRITNK
jgi:hypothetical protein